MNKLIIIFVFIGFFANAQSKKNIKKNNIKEITTYNYVTKLAKTYKIKDNYSEYNEKGYLIKEINYNKEGKIKYTKKYYYDTDNNKIKEEVFSANNKLEKTIITTYKNGLKTSKIVKNNNGSVISKKEIEYTHF